MNATPINKRVAIVGAPLNVSNKLPSNTAAMPIFGRKAKQDAPAKRIHTVLS